MMCRWLHNTHILIAHIYSKIANNSRKQQFGMQSYSETKRLTTTLPSHAWSWYIGMCVIVTRGIQRKMMAQKVWIRLFSIHSAGFIIHAWVSQQNGVMCMGRYVACGPCINFWQLMQLIKRIGGWLCVQTLFVQKLHNMQCLYGVSRKISKAPKYPWVLTIIKF